MALYIPHSIFHLARLLYVGPETFGPYYVPQHNHNGTRYIVKEQNYDKFDKILIELIIKKFQEENLEDIDTNLATHIKENCDIESAVQKLHELLTLSCNKSFKTRGTTKKTTKQKSVP